MLPDAVTKCPHCGSTDSYSYKLTMKGLQTTGFGGNRDCESYEDLSDARHGAARCDSCNKIIKN